MLYRIIGASGSGKTEELFSRLGAALKRNKRCFVIVPEQQSVEYESAITERFGDESNLCCEVLNFERLPNRVARDYGGLAVESIDKGGACALLSLVAESLKSKLTEYAPVASDADFAVSLYGLISQLKMSLITPDMLSDAVNSGNIDDERLKAKLCDIALIYRELENSFDGSLTDPRDALTVLASELPKKPFFENSSVFIDGYYTFTEQEYAVLKSVISQCDELYVTLLTDNERDFFTENDKCAKRLLKLSKGRVEDTVLPPPERGASELLRHLERYIWSDKSLPLCGSDGSVRLITAKNRFDEVEAAAREILSFVREGGRYRDITVLAGNVDSYSAIVDSVFSRAGVPCYLSAKEPLALKPLFSFLLSSLAVVNENFSLRSMKRYIKSGYTDLTVAEADALLSYASAWRLRGKAWYSDEDWTLNPEGFKEGDLSPRAARTLLLANRARRKIIPALSALRDTLSVKGLTVGSAVKALFGHIMSVSADEKLRASAEQKLASGDREGSERELSLWKLLVGILDSLYATCGDRGVTPKRLSGLIGLMCDCCSLGAIPPSSDSVTFGAASLIRAGGSRLVIVLGVCDGEFPSTTKNGFFNRAESVSLESVGLNLGETVKKSLDVNRFFSYTAIAAPTERLVLLCPLSEISGEELRPSVAWRTVKKLLPDVSEIAFSESDFLYSRESVAAALPAMRDCPLKTAITDELVNFGERFFETRPSVTEKTARVAFPEPALRLSPSKFERYVLCPFSFYTQYLLKLEEKKENEFTSSNLGTFAHKLLEDFVKGCIKDGKFVAPSESEREKKLSLLSEKYFAAVAADGTKDDKRFIHIFENMKKTVSYVVKNLSDELSKSAFLPVGFEYRIGLYPEDIPAIRYTVGEDKTVELRGSIDRVDTYTDGDTTYARVIDYKTYDKKLSLDKVEKGFDTQLLHYLFAYCEKTGSRPAGVFYYPVVPPSVSVSGVEDEEKIESELLKKAKPKGFILEDVSVASAMSPDWLYIPAKLTKDNTFNKRDSKTLSEEGFSILRETLTHQVERVGGGIFDGVMDIAPNDCDGKEDPCRFCIAADFCRNAKLKNDEDGGEDGENDAD